MIMETLGTETVSPGSQVNGKRWLLLDAYSCLLFW